MKRKIILTTEKTTQMIRHKSFSGLFNTPWLMMLLLTVFMWQCRKVETPGVSPKVTSTNPISNATGIAINIKISAIFSVEMDPSTINTSTFTLMQGTKAVSGEVSYTDTTALFTPDANLTPSTIYTVTITTGVQDISGKTLAKNYVSSFATGGLSLPTVTLTDPINNATGVALNKLIVITFSEPMDQTTITDVTFNLKQGTTSVPGVVTYASSKATFTPASSLAANKIYTGTITTGAKDMAGNALASNYTFSFTSSDVPDIILPRVNATDPLNNPLNNPTDVALNKVIAITFSEVMTPSTINASTFTLMQGTTAVPGAVSYSGLIAKFTPTSVLAASTTYTATITTEAKDLAGNALAGKTEWSFTTGILPIVNTTDPLNNDTGVALNKVVAITFSKAMAPTTINASTFTLMQGTTAVNGTVAYSETTKTATFTPLTPLADGIIYTATITKGAKDLAGNEVAETVWSFTTYMLPRVNATDPLNNATGVALNKVVAITFNKAMDPLTIIATTFTLMQGTTAVNGTVAYSGTTATFTPSTLLADGITYTATITTEVKDLAGNPLATNTVWSFTTGVAAPTIGAINLGTAGNYVILAKTAISNIPTSAITGDLGLSPAAESLITGFVLTDASGYATAPEVTGKIYAATMADPVPINLTTAVNDMITAYTEAAGRPTPDFLELGTGNIGGKILTPGLYKWGTSVTLPTDVTISGGANDVWIFQIGQDLTMSSAVKITLSGGALAKNIFWQVAGTVSIGTTAHFEGIILSMTGITFQTGASMNGRALAQTAVTLDGNVITKP